MAKMFNLNCLKKRKILNVKGKCNHREKASLDDKTLHAFEHLSLLDSDDEDLYHEKRVQKCCRSA